MRTKEPIDSFVLVNFLSACLTNVVMSRYIEMLLSIVHVCTMFFIKRRIVFLVQHTIYM